MLDRALMLGAMVTHGCLGQYKLVAVNVIYLAVAVFIAVGRFWATPTNSPSAVPTTWPLFS